MDDIIVYLIFVAFALLSRFLTKKKEPQGPPEQSDQRQRQEGEARRPQRQPSFEELLREFSEEKSQTERKPAAQPLPSSPYKSYEDEAYETENYEEQYERDEKARDVYARSVKEAKKLKTIDELVDYDTIKTTLDHNRFDPYDKKVRNTLADDIRRQLQDPREVRKAVIYAEILQRKY